MMLAICLISAVRVYRNAGGGLFYPGDGFAAADGWVEGEGDGLAL